ncbi:MAG TPA: peptidoglycan recognition family protein [Nocardioidaceae bacterium]
MLAAAVGVSALALTASGLTFGAASSSATTSRHGSSGRDCLAAIPAGPATHARQRVFAAASRTYHVPTSVLLGVSYMESRWDDHGASPSTSGGYGPMHLTDVAVEAAGTAKGDGSVNRSTGPASLHTAATAADLTGFSVARLTSDDVANICGGAALLASYRSSSHATGPASWYDAVAAYSGASSAADAREFVHRVFATVRHGEGRTTNDGQRVHVAAHPTLRVPAARLPSAAKASTNPHIDCPRSLDCEWIPAPYEQYGPDPGDYGNHDIANREQDLTIDYIVIHDTETSYDETLDLVQDPTYLGWNYTIRSSDGHVAQHMDAKDIGFQAGNWYINQHSMGIEHEGFAAQGASWFTENLYESSAKLVKYLAKKYTVKLDRAHIIGHDQVPGITPPLVAGMHWDPGPYWDWEHYFDLLGKPIARHGHGGHGHHALAASAFHKNDVVTVAPGFDQNRQLVTGCDDPVDHPEAPCTPQGTNFVYLHTQPSEFAPLVTDVGLHPDGSPSTTFVSDHGARVAAGMKLVVAGHSGDWLGVWYLGNIGWLESPRNHPTVVPSKGRVVQAKAGVAEVPVYGRAYPEESAYEGTGVPVQAVVPLQYSIKAGQKYVLADDTIDTTYYYSTIFDVTDPTNHIVVNGQDKYDEIWFGHRMFFVRVADITTSKH